MNLSDRIRLHVTVFRYDSWLDLKGVPGRFRRELRRELRANLTEAAADRGVDEALRRLGSPEALATADAVALRDPRHPAWGVGLMVSAAVFLVFAWTWFIAALAWFDGARAASPGAGRAEGAITLYPGSHLTGTWSADAMQLDVFYPPLPATVLLLVAFLLASRVWRLARRPTLAPASHAV